MSRHRNVRNAVYDDYDDDDDYQYGRSVEDDCISPTDAQQWMYDRARGQQSMSEFLANNRDIEEEDDEEIAVAAAGTAHKRRDSECYQMPELNDEDRARLLSCMDEIRDIIGDSSSDRQMVEAIMKHDYDCSKALDEILNSNKTPPTAGRSGAKLTSEKIEKDLKASPSTLGLKMPSLNSPRFALPKVQFGTGSNLSDLVKQRLKQEAAKPEPSDTLSDDEHNTDDDDDEQIGLKTKKCPPPSSGVLVSSGVGQLDKLASLSIGSASSTMSTPVPKKSFSNLSDLAKHRLQSQGTPPTFPFSSSPASSAGAHPPLFKVPLTYATQPKQTAETDTAGGGNPSSQLLVNSGWIMDLKSALIKKKPDSKHARSNDLRSGAELQETIKYGFIDCDLEETIKPTIDEYCTIDASSVLKKDLSTHRTLMASAMGTLLTVRYRKRQLPTHVTHKFPKTTTVHPFRFDVPSPDDVVLGHIKRFRR